MWKYYLILALVVALGGAGYTIQRQFKKNGAQAQIIEQQAGQIKAAEKQAKADRALLKRRAAAEKEARFQAKAAQLALGRALFENREWASTPVPQEVQDALTAKP